MDIRNSKDTKLAELVSQFLKLKPMPDDGEEFRKYVFDTYLDIQGDILSMHHMKLVKATMYWMVRFKLNGRWVTVGHGPEKRLPDLLRWADWCARRFHKYRSRQPAPCADNMNFPPEWIEADEGDLAMFTEESELWPYKLLLDKIERHLVGFDYFNIVETPEQVRSGNKAFRRHKDTLYNAYLDLKDSVDVMSGQLIKQTRALEAIEKRLALPAVGGAPTEIISRPAIPGYTAPSIGDNPSGVFTS